MKVAIIGAGWAGMAAAHTLLGFGHDVTIFELSHQAGGRARGLTDTALGQIDNGQHLLIGAYRETIRLIESAQGQETVSSAVPARYLRQPLNLLAADGALSLSINPSLPGVLSRLGALIGAQGLSVRERWRALVLLGGLKLGLTRPANGETVNAWLQRLRQSPDLCQRLWIPLCLATMNTPAEMACASLFARVLKDSLLSTYSGATDLLIPTVDLTQLWVQAVARQVRLRLGVQVTEVMPILEGTDPTPYFSPDLTGKEAATGPRHQVRVHNELFDGCIIATTPASTARIVERWLTGLADHETTPETQETPGSEAIKGHLRGHLREQLHGQRESRRQVHMLLQDLAGFEFLPITTCYVKLEAPFRLPEPMLMLSSGHRTGSRATNDLPEAGPTLGQWVFDRNAPCVRPNTAQDPEARTQGQLAFVISHAGHATFDRKQLAQNLMDQLRQELASSRSQACRTLAHQISAVAASRVISEKRATFAATPGLRRPGCDTISPYIKLAGDWTDTGYPAVLEGAVLSGLKAARALHAALKG